MIKYKNMIILFSWLKKFINFKFKLKKKYLFKIFNNLGIEIIKFKKVFPIKYKYLKNIKKGKINFIKKKKNKYIYIINKKYLIKKKKFIKKNTYVLLEKKKQKYNIVCTENNYDYIIDINTTPNLNYLYFYLNLSYEIYKYLKYKKKKVYLNYKKENKIFFKKIKKNKIIIKNYSKEIILLYSFLLKNNKKKKSNYKIQKKLILSNIIPKNTVIDEINILIKETGIPLEIINIKSNKIIIKNKKKIKIKKKKYFKYNPIVIYDNKKVKKIPGIGNNNFLLKTKNILFLGIYKTNKLRKIFYKYNINTYISNIYKYKINLKNINYIINQLKKKNKIINIINNFKYINIEKKIYFNYINKFIGIKIDKKEIIKIINILEIKIKKNTKKYIYVIFNNLSFIKKKIDLIDYIIKFYGINKIFKKKSKKKIETKFFNNIFNKKNNIINKIKNILINYGFYEVINSPFIKKRNKKLIKIKKKKYYLKNNLIENILNNLKYNLNRKIKRIKLFEIDSIYILKKKKIYEKLVIDFYFIKENKNNIINNLNKLYGILLIIFKIFGINITNFKKKIKYNKKYNIKIIFFFKKKPIFYFSKINNNYFNFKESIYYSNINLNLFFKIINLYKINKLKKYSKYQNIKKDLSFIIKKNKYYEDIYFFLKKKFKKYIIKIKLIDIYYKNLPKNKKSYTIRLIIKNKYGLTKNNINFILLKIIKLLKKKFKIKVKNLLYLS
ncbi:MAG: phenylalanine--tRNA ligase beta subunit-related protein [Candidatus Shikimatogenerans bostrichidophilus]|nr:MAG: phenylalanine--tRNA ligase beta subunit-related protein [Candidatus Shikimatogenerans bostrichidophilus]